MTARAQTVFPQMTLRVSASSIVKMTFAAAVRNGQNLRSAFIVHRAPQNHCSAWHLDGHLCHLVVVVCT